MRHSGWKFRRAGEQAHFFEHTGKYVVAAVCNPVIKDDVIFAGLSRTKPQHRVCQECSGELEVRKREATLPWRERSWPKR